MNCIFSNKSHIKLALSELKLSFVPCSFLGMQVLLFSTMTRLLDVMEDYLVWKKYQYLRLDGHTSGHERGALIDRFNDPDSPAFIFLLR